MTRLRIAGGLVAVAAALAMASGCGKKDEGAAKPAGEAKKEKAKEPPKQPEPPKVDPAVLARGEYLVNIVMGCAGCHTPIGPQGPDMSKMFAGGMEVPEKFGTWRAPNITQDKKTGIGDWTDEQIIAAVREGKRPNGDKLYPIMPYPFYNAMSDDDAKAMVAYLRTIPPVENAVAGNTDLKLPKMDVPAPTGAAPAAGDAVAQGAYLGSLMHCAMCHTPMNDKGLDMTKFMAGGFEFEFPPEFGTGKVYSANLTPDKKTGLGGWTDEEVLAGFTLMKKKDGTPVVGPMMFYPWAKLAPEDAKNIVAWLRSLPAIANKVPKSTFKPGPMLEAMMKGGGGPPPPGGDEAPKAEAPKKDAPPQ